MSPTEHVDALKSARHSEQKIRGFQYSLIDGKTELEITLNNDTAITAKIGAWANGWLLIEQGKSPLVNVFLLNENSVKKVTPTVSQVSAINTSGTYVDPTIVKKQQQILIDTLVNAKMKDWPEALKRRYGNAVTYSSMDGIVEVITTWVQEGCPQE